MLLRSMNNLQPSLCINLAESLLCPRKTTIHPIKIILSQSQILLDHNNASIRHQSLSTPAKVVDQIRIPQVPQTPLIPNHRVLSLFGCEFLQSQRKHLTNFPSFSFRAKKFSLHYGLVERFYWIDKICFCKYFRE